MPWKKLGIGFARKIRFRKIPVKYFSELSLTMTYFIATSTCIASNSTLFTKKCDRNFRSWLTIESLSNEDGIVNENVVKQWFKLQNTVTARGNATTWPLFRRRL